MIVLPPPPPVPVVGVIKRFFIKRLRNCCVARTCTKMRCEEGAAIPQWIRLRLPSCHPCSTPQPAIYPFIIYSQICAIFVHAM